MRRQIVLAACVAAVTVFGLAAAAASLAGQQGLYGGHSQSERNRSAAFVDANRLLTRLRLPAQATFGHAIPHAALHALEGAENHADAGETWTVPGTIGSVIAYVRQHPPRGSSVYGTGYVGRNGSITSRNITFAWSPLNEMLADRHLYVSASPIANHRVKLVVQAEVIWLSARSQSERFPSATTRIELRVTQPHRPTLHRVATRAATVERIVALLNSVPITQPDFYNCPPSVIGQARSFTYQLLSSTGVSLAQISYQIPPRASPGPCASMSVRIDGRAQHTLLGGPQMVEVQRTFGIATARYD